jgi:hypothetical protein
MKNTYESKIAKLKERCGGLNDSGEFPKPGVPMKPDSQESVQESSMSADELKKNKLEKNRESARKSRKIKKQYMEELKQYVEYLEKELDKAQKLN